MTEKFLVGAFIVLVGVIIHYWRANKSSNTQLKEYKELFNLSESVNKELTSKIDNFFEEINTKNLQIERTTSAGEQLGIKLSENNITLRAMEGIVEGLKTTLEYEQEQYAKLIGQKKSSEVRTGKIAEQLAPFLADYPFNPEVSRFIGDPIDLVVFSEDKITFVEVKSGKSQLSTKQRKIRDMILAGKVDFLLYRIKGE